jgi:hypothetical protein
MSTDITVQRQGRAMAAAEQFSGDAGRSLDRLESCSISHRSEFDAFPQYEYPVQFKGLASKNAGFRFLHGRLLGHSREVGMLSPPRENQFPFFRCTTDYVLGLAALHSKKGRKCLGK